MLVGMDVATAGREARERARLSQVVLAERAGTTQSAVSSYEVGHRVPSWHMLDRLLEACGFAARLRLQPRHFEIDRELDALLARPPVERLSKWSSIVEEIAALESPVVVIGAAALVAHGVPVQVSALDLAVGVEPNEVTGALAMLTRLWARYYPTHNEDPVPHLPAKATVTMPGCRQLSTVHGPIVLWPGQLGAVRDRAVGVPVGEGIVWVAALPDIEPPSGDADLVRRYLDRLAARSRQSELVVHPILDGQIARARVDRSPVGVGGGFPGLDLCDLWSLGE